MQRASWGLALALFASPALAQVDVARSVQSEALAQAAAEAPKAPAKPKMEIYGRIHISLDGVNMDTPSNTARPAGAAQYGTFLQLPSNTSLIGFRGSQDLGALPLKAIWQIESNVNATSGSAITNTFISSRDTFVGLSSPVGTLKAGFFYSPYYYAVDKLDPLALTIADMRAVIHNTGWGNKVEFSTRLTHSIQYASPDFSGFQFQVQYTNPEQVANVPGGKRVTAYANTTYNAARNNGDGDVLGGIYAAALTYKSGPLYAAVGYERHNQVDRTGDGLGIEPEQGIEVGLGVTLPTKTTITGIYEYLNRSGTGDGADRTRPLGLFLSLKQDIGDESLIGSFGYAGESKIPGGNDGGGFFGLAFFHHFAKSTDAYLAFSKAFNSSAAQWGLGTQGHGSVINPVNPGEGPMALSIGLVHRFSFGL